MLRRLDRYLLGEMILPFLGGLMLIIVMLIGNTLFPLIQLIVKNGIPLKVVAKLIVFNIPTLVVLTLPAGVALASAWAVNRLERDSEITAIRMAGVPLMRLFLPIFCVGIASSLFALWVGDRVVPRAQREFSNTQNEMFAYSLQSNPTVSANKVFTFKQYAFHIGQIIKDPTGDPNRLRLKRVTAYKSPDSDGFPTLITAQSADYYNNVWTLHNAVVQSIGPDGFVMLTANGKTMHLNLGVPLNNLAASDFERPDELSIAELSAQMNALSKTGQDFTAVAVELYSKVALPFVCFAFALCAPPLALRFARTGAYTGIFLSIVMVWVAWNTLLLTKYLGLSGKLPPIVAAWSPDILFLVLGIWMLWRAEKAR